MDGIIIRWETRNEIKLYIEEKLDPDIEYISKSLFKSPRMAETLARLSELRANLIKTVIVCK